VDFCVYAGFRGISSEHRRFEKQHRPVVVMENKSEKREAPAAEGEKWKG
jgi:hypothetical protein